MEDWRRSLRDGDPVSREPALNGDDVDRIRRAVLTAEPRTARAWRMRLAVLSVAAAAVVGALWVDRTVTHPLPADPPVLAAPPPSTSGAVQRRQVQFATPGGTRVIWVFDSTFDMR